jgi:hypothetical protein
MKVIEKKADPRSSSYENPELMNAPWNTYIVDGEYVTVLGHSKAAIVAEGYRLRYEFNSLSTLQQAAILTAKLANPILFEFVWEALKEEESARRAAGQK